MARRIRGTRVSVVRKCHNRNKKTSLSVQWHAAAGTLAYHTWDEWYLGTECNEGNKIFFFFGKRAQSRCTDGPFNWPSISHENYLLAILCVHGHLFFSFLQFTTIQKRSSWDNSLSQTQIVKVYYSLHTQQNTFFFFTYWCCLSPRIKVMKYELMLMIKQWLEGTLKTFSGSSVIVSAIKSLSDACWGWGSSISFFLSKSWAKFAGTWLTKRKGLHQGPIAEKIKWFITHPLSYTIKRLI